MNPLILTELARRWETEASDTRPIPEGEELRSAGRRETLRECADALRMLVQLLSVPRPL